MGYEFLARSVLLSLTAALVAGANVAWSQDFLVCKSDSAAASHSRGNLDAPTATDPSSHDDRFAALPALPFLSRSGAEVRECRAPARPSPFKRRLSAGLQRQNLKQLLSGLIGDDSVSYLGLVPSIVVENSPAANAFARGKSQVVITGKLLDQLRNEAELGFVLAHELAHLTLHHTAPGDVRTELEADALALEFVRDAHLDPCAGAAALRRLAAADGGFFSSVPARLSALEAKTAANCKP